MDASDSDSDDFQAPSATRRRRTSRTPAPRSQRKRTPNPAAALVPINQQQQQPPPCEPRPPRRDSSHAPPVATAAIQAPSTSSQRSPPQQAGHFTAQLPQQQQEQEQQQEHEPPRGSSACPVCGVVLGRVSDTSAGQAAHVNACVDALGGPAADDVVDLVASCDDDGDGGGGHPWDGFGGGDAAATDEQAQHDCGEDGWDIDAELDWHSTEHEGTVQQQQQHEVQPWQPQPQPQPQPWQQHQQHQPLQPLSPNRLSSAGGSRRQQQLLQQQQSSITGWTVRQQPQQQEQQQPHDDAKRQWAKLFKQPRQALGMHKDLPAPPRQMTLTHRGSLAPPAAAAAAGPAAAGAAAAAAGGAALLQGAASKLPGWLPAWQQLPGAGIVVDGGWKTPALGSGRFTWLLTHFHADHYGGLTRGFSGGPIICTPITAALVQLKLRVPRDRLVVLELGQEVVVQGTRLTLIDANHCPGSAMVVAHPPGAPPVLHTGDARLTREATQDQPLLQALVGKAVLVLDTTYADPAYCFPPQQEVLDWVLRAVKAELFNPRTCILFGTYTIGKERLFLHVASALQRKVYVAAAKRSIMACLGLPQHLAALLTDSHLDACIHAVPMGQVTLETMEALLLRYKGRYTSVVGFKPTGWSYGGAGGGAAGPSRSSLSIKPNRRRTQRGTVVLYSVPYSEHSSCAELREFVAFFKPLRIIPSVNNDQGPRLRQMLATLAASPSAPTVGPMDAFVRPQQQQQRGDGTAGQ